MKRKISESEFYKVRQLEILLKSTANAGKRRDIRREQEHFIKEAFDRKPESKCVLLWKKILRKVDTNKIPKDDPSSKYNAFQKKNKRIPIFTYGMISVYKGV